MVTGNKMGHSIGDDIKHGVRGIWHFFTKGKYSFLIACLGFFCVMSVVFYEFTNIERYVESMGWLGIVLLIIFPLAKLFDACMESAMTDEGSIAHYLKKRYGIKPDTYASSKDEVKLVLATSIMEGKIGGKDRPAIKDVTEALKEIEKL